MMWGNTLYLNKKPYGFVQTPTSVSPLTLLVTLLSRWMQLQIDYPIAQTLHAYNKFKIYHP